MALVRTNEISAGTETATTVTGSFTPPNNSLLVVGVCGLNSIQDTNSSNFTVSGGGLTWTSRLFSNSVNGGNHQWVGVYTAPVTTGVSMTVTATASSGAYDVVVAVVAYTGYDTSTPIGVTGSNSWDAAQSGTLTYNLSGTPAGTSEVIALYNALTPTSTMAAGTGWTNQYNGVVGRFTQLFVFTNATLASPAVTTGTVSAGYGVESIAIEIKASGSPPTKSLLFPQKKLRFFNRRY